MQHLRQLLRPATSVNEALRMFHLGVLHENGLLLEDNVEHQVGVVIRATIVLDIVFRHRRKQALGVI